MFDINEVNIHQECERGDLIYKKTQVINQKIDQKKLYKKQQTELY